MANFQIFSHISVVLSTELIEKCHDVSSWPWDKNNELLKSCLKHDVKYSVSNEGQSTLEGSWRSMILIYNHIESFLEKNFGIRSNFLTFEEHCQEETFEAEIYAGKAKVLANGCNVEDTAIQLPENTEQQRDIKVPDPIVVSYHSDKSFAEIASSPIDNNVSQIAHEELFDKNEFSENKKIKEETIEPLEMSKVKTSFKHKSEIPQKSKKATLKRNINESADEMLKQKKHLKGRKNSKSKRIPAKLKKALILKSNDSELLTDVSNVMNVENIDGANEVLFDNDRAEQEIKTEQMINLLEKKGKKQEVTLKIRSRKLSAKNVKSAANLPDTEDSFSCVECMYVTNKKSNLREHFQRMHEVKKFSCESCDKIFSIHKDLLRHEKSHVRPELCCDFCGKMYKSHRTFTQHKKCHEEHYKKPEYECETCKKVFSTKYVLNYHVKSEHKGIKKQFLCPTCGKSFTQKNSYLQHANVHLGLKPYQCEQCGKSFSYEKSLKEHKFMHDDVLHFKCDVCDKLFRQKSALQIHKKIHKENKDHLCNVCGKGFTQRQALLRHERIHNGDKPFKCGLCERTFTDASIIRRHMIMVHKKHPKGWREDVLCELKGANDFWIDGKKPEGRLKRLPIARKNETGNSQEAENKETPQTTEAVTQCSLDSANNKTENNSMANTEKPSQENSINHVEGDRGYQTTDQAYIQETIFNVSNEPYVKEPVMYLRKNPPNLDPTEPGVMINTSSVSQYIQHPQISNEMNSSVNIDSSFNDSFTHITDRKTEHAAETSFQRVVSTGNQWTAEPYNFNNIQYLPNFSNYQNQ